MARRKGLRSLTIKELEGGLRYLNEAALSKSGRRARVARSMAHSHRSAINYKRRRAGTQKGMKKPR